MNKELSDHEIFNKWKSLHIKINKNKYVTNKTNCNICSKILNDADKSINKRKVVLCIECTSKINKHMRTQKNVKKRQFVEIYENKNKNKNTVKKISYLSSTTKSLAKYNTRYYYNRKIYKKYNITPSSDVCLTCGIKLEQNSKNNDELKCIECKNKISTYYNDKDNKLKIMKENESNKKMKKMEPLEMIKKHLETINFELPEIYMPSPFNYIFDKDINFE